MRALKARRRWLAVALLVLWLAPAAATAGVIPLDLRFDGQPLEPTAPPDFTCFSAIANAWVSCPVKRGEGPGAWLLDGLAPGSVPPARQHRRESGEPASLPRRLRGAAPVRGHRARAGAPHGGHGPAHSPDAPGRQCPLARRHAHELRDPARLRDAAPLLGPDGAHRVRVGADRPRRRVPGERDRGVVLAARPPAGGPARDDGRDRGDPEPAAERGRRAVLLLDRGLARRSARRRSLHPRRRRALVELPLPGPQREPVALGVRGRRRPPAAPRRRRGAAPSQRPRPRAGGGSRAGRSR